VRSKPDRAGWRGAAVHTSRRAKRGQSRRHPKDLRTEAGRQEVDLVIDLGGGRLIAAEVKATSAPTTKDARYLAWLRDELGDSFTRGIVFHTGRHPHPLGDRIWALPIATLWA